MSIVEGSEGENCYDAIPGQSRCRHGYSQTCAPTQSLYVVERRSVYYLFRRTSFKIMHCSSNVTSVEQLRIAS